MTGADSRFEAGGTMKQNTWLWAAVVGADLLAGCVERRFVVTTDPPGAIVLENGRPIGASPGDDHFVYYGNYHFTLIKDGFESLQVDQKIPAPWYEYFPLDFFSENLIPWHIEDVHRFHYQLKPLPMTDTGELLRQSEQLRARGRSLTPAATASEPEPPPPTLMPPVVDNPSGP